MDFTSKQNKQEDKAWRVTAAIRDKDLELAVKHRAIDDSLKIEEIVIEGLRLYLQQPARKSRQ